MNAGCYDLALYCDGPGPHEYDEFPKHYTDELGSVCRRRARKAGWIIGKERDLCPKCSGKKRTAPPAQETGGLGALARDFARMSPATLTPTADGYKLVKDKRSKKR